MDKKHLFIINPKSFWNTWKQDEILARINQFFASENLTNYTIHISRFPRDAAGFIPAFAKELPDDTAIRVYAVGGDGILFDCLNGIMGLKNAELAAIPYGRTHNFLRGFGKNFKTAFRKIQQQYNAEAIPVDVLRCGNNYALSYCAAGVEAEAARLAEKTREIMYGKNALVQWLCRRMYTLLYYAGVFAACWNKNLIYRRYEVYVDGKSFNDVCLGIGVFNGPYYGGDLHPVKDAMPNDGVFDMLVIRGPGFWRTFSMLPFYVSGRHGWFPGNFALNQGKRISIRCKDPLPVSMDGVIFYEPHLEIELLPAAVRFVDAGRLGYAGTKNG